MFGYPLDRIIDILWQMSYTVGLAAVLAFAIDRGLRRRLRAALWMAMALLPMVLFYLLRDNARVYSYHGMMHTAIVLQFLDGIRLPEEPLLAGNRLLYPWAWHALTALVARLLHIPISFAFALLNALALAGTLVLLYRIMRRFTSNHQAHILGPLMAIFATCVLNRTPFMFVIGRLSGFLLEDRGIPASEKFTNVNAMPLGILAYAGTLHALIGLTGGGGRTRLSWTLLCLSLIAGGYFYPLTFIGQVAIVIVAWGMWLLESPRPWPRIVTTPILSGLSALCVLPYALLITEGKANEAIGLAPNLGYAFKSLSNEILTFLPIALLILSARAPIVAFIREDKTRARVIGGIVLVNLVLYVLLAVPLRSHYKFETMAAIPLGLLGGMALAECFRRRESLGFALLFFFLLPYASDLGLKLTSPWEVTDPFVEKGTQLHLADPAADLVHQWIAGHTPRDAYFFDTRLTLPVFARRSLFVGLEPDPASEKDRGKRVGWNASITSELIEVNGYPEALVLERTTLAKTLLKGSRALSPDVLATLDRLSHLHPIFVVTRSEGQRRRIEHTGAFLERLHTETFSVFQYQNAGNQTP